MAIVSGILFWLLVWFVVSIPVSLALAQRLKAAAARLGEESARLPEIRRSAIPRSGPEVRRRPRKRLPALGASPAVSR